MVVAFLLISKVKKFRGMTWKGASDITGSGFEWAEVCDRADYPTFCAHTIAHVWPLAAPIRFTGSPCSALAPLSVRVCDVPSPVLAFVRLSGRPQCGQQL